MPLHKFENAKHNVEVCSWLFGLVRAGVDTQAKYDWLEY